MTTWSASEVRTFLGATADDDLSALWRLALLTGMRRGELLALRWQDVNLDSGMLSVRRTLTYSKAGYAFGEPKTAKGKRRIELDSGCVDALRAHRTRQLERRLMYGSVWIDTDLVFENGTGSLLPPNVLGKRFQQAAKATGLPRIRLHDLRHTAASLMLENGAHPKIVQERLGHSDIAMTLNRYSHVMPGMQRDVTDRLAALLEA
jgi:integrase